MAQQSCQAKGYNNPVDTDSDKSETDSLSDLSDLSGCRQNCLVLDGHDIDIIKKNTTTAKITIHSWLKKVPFP
jgi:hypothetical protein